MERRRIAGKHRRGSARTAALTVLVVAALGAALAMYYAVRGVRTPGNDAAPRGRATTGTIDGVLNSVRTLVRDGEVGKADAMLEEAIAANPTEQRLYVSRAEVMALRQNPAGAYSMYEKAIALGGQSDGELQFAAGTVASMAGRLDRAAEHFGAAQGLMRSDHRPSLYLAQVQIKQDQIEAAKANLVIAGKLNPDVAAVWGTLADLELRSNRTGLALQHVAKARGLEPRVTLWRLIEARALKREGKAEEALQTLIGVDEAERRQSTVLALMSECYGMLSRPGDAAELYVRAAEADTTNADLALQAAAWLERSGDKRRAATWADRAKMLGASGAEAILARVLGE